MRSVHGEGGGREALCTYCGEGFATGTRARQHEVKVHMEDNPRGTFLSVFGFRVSASYSRSMI